MTDDKTALLSRVEEIKNLCRWHAEWIRDEPDIEDHVSADIMEDAAALIEALEGELAQVRRERDAAVEDIMAIAAGGGTWMCPYCAHCSDVSFDFGIADCDLDFGACSIGHTRFEWRGPQGGEEHE